LRYEAHLSRQFHKSLNDLTKLTWSEDDLIPAREDAAEVVAEAGADRGEAAEAVAPNEPKFSAEAQSEERVASDPNSDESAPEPTGKVPDDPEMPVAQADRDRGGRMWPVEGGAGAPRGGLRRLLRSVGMDK
jgi:hypothetical protein